MIKLVKDLTITLHKGQEIELNEGQLKLIPAHYYEVVVKKEKPADLEKEKPAKVKKEVTEKE